MRRFSPNVPAWLSATTLTERVAILRDRRSRAELSRFSERRARRRLKEWRAQLPFNVDVLFKKRLANDRITMRGFRIVLGAPASAIRWRQPPQWLTELDRGFGKLVCPAALPVPPGLRGNQMLGMLEVVAPLIHMELGQVRESVRALVEAGVVVRSVYRSIEETLLDSLYRRLLMIVGRTMVLELNVARLRGILKGSSAKERYCEFLRRLARTDVALRMLEEYPVLARQIAVRVKHWSDAATEFFSRLLTDYAAIGATFGGGKALGTLVEVKWGAGDTHRRGRAVAIASFSSGTRVVYKPRSLAVDRHFQALLAWANANWGGPEYRILKVLDRATHGWVEFAEPAACTSVEEVARFYTRQGGYLALLHALNATDFHCENILASGEHPVLVDLEALFHPSLFAGLRIPPRYAAADRILSESVARTGMLPRRLFAKLDSDGVDISALGATPGQIAPGSVSLPEAAGTDEMRFVRKEGLPLGLGFHSHPTAANVSTDVLNYADELVDGFSMMYRALARNHRKLLSTDGLLTRFASAEVRVVLRGTRAYSLLLTESYHPDLQRDALDRDQFLDKLWLAVAGQPHLSKVIAAEREDLENGDVPIFTTTPGSRSLWTSSGRRIAGFTRERSLCEVAARLRMLNEEDLGVQTRIIRMSLATLVTGSGVSPAQRRGATEPVSPSDPSKLRAALIEEALSVARRLAALALRAAGDVNWLAVEPVGERTSEVRPMGVTLYSGFAGVVLFLATLEQVTGSKQYASLAEDALAAMRRRLGRLSKSGALGIGCHNGLGGIIYTLTRLAAFRNAPHLLRSAAAFLPTIDALVGKDNAFEVMSGAAGCILSLACLYRAAPSEDIVRVAVKCGDRLLKCARPQQHGIAWSSGSSEERPLLGMAHGVAGIAWALCELAAMSGKSRFLAAARQAVAYERGLFSRARGNWPDLRKLPALARGDGGSPGDKPRYQATWCHGAPGIGIARLMSLRHLDDAATRKEINVALETTIKEGFGGGLSLCHGDLGNVDLLLLASEILGDSRWRAEADRVAASSLKSIREHGWLCGTVSQQETPGLMTGLAGIGYELLRLAEPDLVPSVLGLCPPRAALACGTDGTRRAGRKDGPGTTK